ncbi:MAG: tetratricopeptide repeat protein [Candidatus Portnoybacteria bacterium]|nr:tetratricopeptide repeat protein [Candidatus Portnoybacteria bacterium]
MTILKFILLASFIGLAVMVAKNRISNPEARIQFIEDMDRNKKRIKRTILFVAQFGNETGKKLFGKVKELAPQIKKGLLLFLADCRGFLFALKTKIAHAVKELREDMKAFEIPVHKKDFIERLGEEKTEKEPPPAFLADQGIKESEVKGFAITSLPQEEVLPEAEVDVEILEKKEQGLIDAIAKNPKNPNFYKKLGKIYLQMQNLEDARNCLEHALKLGAKDPEIKSLLLEIERTPARVQS